MKIGKRLQKGASYSPTYYRYTHPKFSEIDWFYQDA